jgi:hypothetical protein
MLTATANHPASTIRGLEVNTLWDGLFLAVTYLLVTVGIFMMWTRLGDEGSVRSWRGLVGGDTGGSPPERLTLDIHLRGWPIYSCTSNEYCLRMCS